MPAKKQTRRANPVLPQVLPNPFNFLTLPAEVRNMVYKHLVISSHPIHPPEQHPSDLTHITALFLVNHQINKEASAIFYETNTITLCTSQHAEMLQTYNYKSFATKVNAKKVKGRGLGRELASLNAENREAEARRRQELNALRRTKYVIENTYPALVQRMANIELNVEFIGLYSTMHPALRYVKHDVEQLMDMLCGLGLGTWVGEKPTLRRTLTISFPDLHSMTDIELELLLVILKGEGFVKLIQEVAKVRSVKVVHRDCDGSVSHPRQWQVGDKEAIAARCIKFHIDLSELVRDSSAQDQLKLPTA